MPKSKHDPEAVDAYSRVARRRANHSGGPAAADQGHLAQCSGEISYGTSVIFAVKRDLVGFVAQEKHLSFFTMSTELAKSMRDEIKGTHRVSGATIHFSPDNPLPRSLLKTILRARLEEEAVG